MKTKHTPGPWKFDDVWSLITGEGGEEICAIHSATQSGDRRRFNRDVSNANAALIASAPDLLNALERMANYKRSSDDVHNAIAIIKKAKGEV